MSRLHHLVRCDLYVAFSSRGLLRLRASDHVFGLTANAADARTHALLALIDHFSCAVRKIAGAIHKIVTSLFAAHRGEQDSQTYSNSESNQKTFHAKVLQLNCTGFYLTTSRFLRDALFLLGFAAHKWCTLDGATK